MKLLVSILIPAYNSSEWIADTLRSALAQTWARKEIIVVDDGSKDDTLKIARQFERLNVKVITQENQGAAAARNKAFSLCQGEYIQWLDADDLLSPNKISQQMAYLNTGLGRKTLLSSPWGYFLYRSKRTSFISNPLFQDLSPADWLILKLGRNLHMQTGTWLVSRQLTQAAGAWDTSMLVDDDGEYFCRVLLKSDGVKFIDDGAKLYYRAVGTRSLSYMGNSDKKLEAQWRSMQLHIAALRSLEDSERVREACVKYLQTWFFFFYPERQDLVRAIEQTALDLGGRVEPPTLSWKYRWIQPIFGWTTAKKARLALPNLKWNLARSWDKAMFKFENSAG